MLDEVTIGKITYKQINKRKEVGVDHALPSFFYCSLFTKLF